MIADSVAQVNFYPIKSAQAATVNGEVLTELPVGETGFEVRGVRDRDWILFDPADNCFVSQRGWDLNQKPRHPEDRRLAAVQLDVRDDHTSVSSDIGTLELPNSPVEGDRSIVKVFSKLFPVIEQGSEASSYFSKLLGREVQLLRSDRENPRIIPEKYQREGAINKVAGADGFPFLLVSLASLQAAHARNGMADGTVPINRYRGNIVIAGDGIGAFKEDYIDTQTQFSIGSIGMWVVKACARCPIPNTDQVTGAFVGGGLKVLRGRNGRIFTGDEGVFFGQNLLHANIGSIGVGDAVNVALLSDSPNVEFRES